MRRRGSMKNIKILLAVLFLCFGMATMGWCLSISDTNAGSLDGSNVGSIDNLLVADTKTVVDTFKLPGMSNTEVEAAWANDFLSSSGDTATFDVTDKIEDVPYYDTTDPDADVFAFYMTEPPISDYFIIKNSQGYALYENEPLTSWGVFDTSLTAFISDLNLPTDDYEISHVTRSSGGDVPVPEPATILLISAGLIGVVGASRRKKLKNNI